MSTLGMADKQFLEKFFGMASGYVLNFSDRTFGEFVFEAVGLEIHSERYTAGGTSKANKLRTFWKLESDPVVGKLALALINYGVSFDMVMPQWKQYEPQCREIAARLLSGSPSSRPVNEQAQAPTASAAPGSQISDVTRRDIVDFISAKRVKWWGRLEEIEFLSRLYSLKKLPSTDPRYKTAEDDIGQHRVNNDDWADDWIFKDDRFNLLRGTDDEFLRFLCETLNPIVRPKPPEVNALLKVFNKHLAVDGWELYAKHHISRRRVFAARRLTARSKTQPAEKVTLTANAKAEERTHDVFICHASEDKKGIARPLAEQLMHRGYTVWFDEFTLKLGDSLRRSIDRGLLSSRYGIVILSPSFFAKNWPQYELDALVRRENSDGAKVILPVWHNVTRQQVAAYSLTLADRLAAVTTNSLHEVCNNIAEVLDEGAVHL